MSDLNLCHMVSQTVELQTVGGRGGGWGQASTGHIGILPRFWGGRSHKVHWKAEKALCVRLLSSGSWLVLIFISDVRGICGSLAADVRHIIWHFFRTRNGHYLSSQRIGTVTSLAQDSTYCILGLPAIQNFYNKERKCLKAGANSACFEVEWQKS